MSWNTETTVWGSIEPLSGREYFSQQQVQAEARVRIVMRYNADIDTTWRVKNDGRYYDIVDVINPNDRNHMLVLMCRQGVSEDTGDATANALLLESGDSLLLESGDKLLLEA